MTPINFRLMFQSLKARPWTGRSLQASALILVLAAASVTPALAQSQSFTWQNTLARLFGRQQQKGGTRGPSFCSVSPVYYKAMPRSEGARVFNAGSQRLLTDKPLIGWYGNVSRIKIRNRSMPTVPVTVISIPTQKPKEETPLVRSKPLLNPVFNQIQYEGEPLLPGQDYELTFITLVKSSDSSKKEIEQEVDRYRFRTVSQADRDRLNDQLKDLAAKATKTNADPTLTQVDFLLQQNLVNDAQMLILQQSNPSPELAVAIATTQSPCEAKLKIKTPSTPATPGASR
jgi:hypothetical protein